MGQPRSLFVYFRPFQTNNTIFKTNQCEKMSCPSSIWRWDSNPQPWECESPPITTRPGLPPAYQWSCMTKLRTLMRVELLGQIQYRIFQYIIFAMLIFEPSDWFKNSQFECLKMSKVQGFKLATSLLYVPSYNKHLGQCFRPTKE